MKRNPPAADRNSPLALPAKEFEQLISTHTYPAQAQEIDPAATQSRLALG